MSLNDVTLVTLETHYHSLATRALEECTKRLPIKNVVTFSDVPLLSGAKHVPITKTDNMRDYCDIMLKCMWPFIETSHVIFVQWDAMVHDQTKWTDDYLNYDYIGAVWPWQQPGNNIGNGGFSLRSMKLLQALRYPVIQLVPEGPHGISEDNYIGIAHRNLLEQKFGIKFPTDTLAKQFSYELGDYSGSMAFHGFWNIIKFMPKETVDFYVRNRPANIFNNMYRSHHTIFELAERGYLDLFELCLEDIKAGPDFEKVFQWLGSENFANRDFVLKKLAE